MMTKIPFKCPICDGVGLVPGGYYNRAGTTDWMLTSSTEPCRQCNGTGIVWGETEFRFFPQPVNRQDIFIKDNIEADIKELRDTILNIMERLRNIEKRWVNEKND